MTETHELLRQGIALAKAGKREDARALLMQVIETDERNEMAWMWLSGVVDDPADQRVCLENVLEINPGNPHARKGLTWLNEKHPPVAEPPPAEPLETVVDPEPTPVIAEQAREVNADYYDPPRERMFTADTVTEVPSTTDPPDEGGDRFLSYDGKTPLALRRKEATPETTVIPTLHIEEDPCPFCGAPTNPTQQRCTQCRNSLMVRSEGREQRSGALTILSILWFISGGFSILAGILLLALVLFAAAQPTTANPEGNLVVVGVFAVIPLIFGGLYIYLARGLLQRRTWAYIVNCGLLGLSAVSVLCSIVQSVQIVASLPTLLGPPGALPPGAESVIAVMQTVMGVVIFVNVGMLLLYIILTALSYRDFFSPKQRFLADVPKRDHQGHYNAGIAYKNRGMWYLASKEWEQAVRKYADDANYHHALGLAYAQLNQFGRAQTALQEAQSRAPGDARIQESLNLVEKRAARKG